MEHEFAQYIRILGKGRTGSRSLSLDEADKAFSMILQGQVQPEQTGAFLMLLRVKEESAEEIAGFVLACRRFINSQTPPLLTVDLDWSSYAGKRTQPNWYVLSILLLASQGYRIIVHGTRGHTAGRVYTQDAFEHLRLPVAHSWQGVEPALSTQSLCYLPLEVLCQPLEQLIQLRQLFGLRSPVHTLCRLLNPLAAPATLQSVFHPGYANTHQIAAQLLNERSAMVIKGDSGEFEYRPQANLNVKQLIGGQLQEFVIPRLRETVNPPDNQPIHLKALWEDCFDATQEEGFDYARAIVTGTAALALLTMQVTENYASALAQANSLWEGRDRSLLKTLAAS